MRVKELLKENLENPVDKITVDVPLFIRLLEYAREDAKTDMDLHDLTERIISMSAEGQTLTMQDYDAIAGNANLAEDVSGGGTGAGAFGTSMGGGAGFGKSIFMKRATEESTLVKKKKSKR